MNMNKKDIIYQLAKGVYELSTPATYGSIRRRLIESQGVSEIGLYGAVADHLEENDIPPKKYISDMQELLTEGSQNIFVVKNKDKFSYLAHRFSTFSLEGSPESQGKFLCIRCFNVKNSDERCKKPNYKNCCQPCYKENSRENSKRYAEKKKIRELEEKNKPIEELPEELPEEIILEEKPEVSVSNAPIESNPFIELESISGDASDVMLSITCSTIDLSKLLLLIDPYMLPPSKKEPESLPEAVEAPEKNIEETIEE